MQTCTGSIQVKATPSEINVIIRQTWLHPSQQSCVNSLTNTSVRAQRELLSRLEKQQIAVWWPQSASVQPPWVDPAARDCGCNDTVIPRLHVTTDDLLHYSCEIREGWMETWPRPDNETRTDWRPQRGQPSTWYEVWPEPKPEHHYWN